MGKIKSGSDLNFTAQFFHSSELYGALFENSSDNILVVDKMTVVDCNRPACKLFDAHTKAELAGKTITELSVNKPIRKPSSKETLFDYFESVKTDDAPRYKWAILKTDGTPIQTEIRITPFRVDEQEFTLIFITETAKNQIRQKNEPIMLPGEKDSETKYKRIFDSVQDLYYRTNPDGVVVEVSPSIKKYADQIDENIVGQSIQKYYYNLDDRQVILDKLSKSGEIFDYEIPLKGKNGQKIWTSVSAHFLYDENKEILGLEGWIRDISERKQDQEKLKRSFSLLQATLNSTTDGILVVNHSGKISGYNEAFKEIFRLSEKILSSRSDEEALNEAMKILKDPDHFISKVQYLYNHPKLESHDIIEFTDGRIIERFSKAQMLDGEPVGRVWSFRDVTEQKKTEAQLKLMAQTLKSINECISITDTADNILFVNRAFEKTYGYTLDELAGKSISIVRSPQYKDLLIGQVLNSKDDLSWKGELLNRKKDGTDFLISLSTTVVRNEKDEVLGLVGVASDISERKQSEQELKENEERYRSLFEGSPDAIFLADAETGIILGANSASASLLKMPVDQIIGMHQTELHPDSRSEKSRKVFKEHLSLLSRNEPFRSYESQVKCSDGTIIPVEIMSNIIHINGKPALQGVFRNVSERKKAEAELQEKEALLNTLVQTIPDSIWVKDKNGVFLTCNKTFENFLGRPASEIIGKNDYDFFDREQADFFREYDKKAIEKGSPATNEEWITFASDSHRVLLETIKSPMYDFDGEIIGVLGIGRDITDRKKAEEKLRQSEEKYRNLIETLPDGVYRSTPEGKFVEVNPAMVKILGYDSKEELLAIDIKKELYFDIKDRESIALNLNKEELDVFPLKKKDGTAVYIEDHGWFVTDENDKVIFHEGISRDVTERRMAEMQLKKYSEELQEVNATKDKFFSIIAHDLKSPFSSINGLSEILKNEARHLDISTIEQYAGIINYTSNNTYQLLENLLEWSLVQQSRIEYRPGTIVVHNIVKDILELMAEKISSKQITATNLIPENLVIRADENMIKTVFRNLISNALKFTSTKGKIEISAVSRKNQIEFSVKDSGIGISQENVAKIFNIDSTYIQRGTENEKGTGLGLLLCKEFVEKHNGEIWVESEIGVGSTFKFSLPANK